MAVALLASTAAAQAPGIVAVPAGAWICDTAAEVRLLLDTAGKQVPRGCGRLKRAVVVVSVPVGLHDLPRHGLRFRIIKLVTPKAVQFAPVLVGRIAREEST